MPAARHEVAERSDWFVTMVTARPDVRPWSAASAGCSGGGGRVRGVDMSTIPRVTRKLAAARRDRRES